MAMRYIGQRITAWASSTSAKIAAGGGKTKTTVSQGVHPDSIHQRYESIGNWATIAFGISLSVNAFLMAVFGTCNYAGLTPFRKKIARGSGSMED